MIRHPDIAAQLTAALHGEEIGGQELTLARDPGRTLLTRAAPVTGPSGGAVLVLHDITDLRRADQIRRDFVANVSHELRTPLTAIRGYVEALLDGPADPENTHKFLEIIARHSTRMERLVKDLLRLARLDARQELLETARCDIKQIFSAVTADLAPTIEDKSQRITVDVIAEARHVEGDPAKLHDIIRNLVENAVNYSPEGAEVRLGATQVNGTYTITVADSGPGIPMKIWRGCSSASTVWTIAVAARWHRPRTRDCEAPCGTARRRSRGCEPAGRRRRVYDQPAIVRNEAGLKARLQRD